MKESTHWSYTDMWALHFLPAGLMRSHAPLNVRANRIAMHTRPMDTAISVGLFCFAKTGCICSEGGAFVMR